MVSVVQQVELERIRVAMSRVLGIDKLLVHEIRKAQRLSAELSVKGESGAAIGYAHVAQWLLELSSDLNINLKDIE